MLQPSYHVFCISVFRLSVVRLRMDLQGVSCPSENDARTNVEHWQKKELVG
jgi:hypothetical protein